MSLLRIVSVCLIGLMLVPGLGAQEILRGRITVDGSAATFLVVERMAAEFKKKHPDVTISIGISGTGGGFKKFVRGEIDIAGGVRRLKPAERAKLQEMKVSVLELQVAWDAVGVVIHPQNNWARRMTVEQLRHIWHPKTAAKLWSDVDRDWPVEEIRLFGPGADSTTFDFFTDAIVGKEKLTRPDFAASEDDNVIVAAVRRNRFALGYMNLGALLSEVGKGLGRVAIAVKAGDESVFPTKEAVVSGRYQPLTRPLFLWHREETVRRPEVAAFLAFCLERQDPVRAASYLPLSEEQRRGQREQLKASVAKK